MLMVLIKRSLQNSLRDLLFKFYFMEKNDFSDFRNCEDLGFISLTEFFIERYSNTKPSITSFFVATIT